MERPLKGPAVPIYAHLEAKTHTHKQIIYISYKRNHRFIVGEGEHFLTEKCMSIYVRVNVCIWCREVVCVRVHIYTNTKRTGICVCEYMMCCVQMNSHVYLYICMYGLMDVNIYI